jgi:2-amino-4-hydroxy-6-hydroxymethyldihydropteridine diphosphokinase
MKEPALTVPDPEIHQRVFLAVPLHELAPDAVLPDTGEPLSEVVARLDASQLRPAQGFTRRMKARFGLWTSNASNRSSANC